jgi:ferredoxin
MISPASRGCGRCVDARHEGAIELTVVNKGYLEDSFERIDSLVDEL